MKQYINKGLLKLVAVLLLLMGAAESCTPDSNLREGIREITFKPTVNATLINVGETITYVDSSINVSSRLWTFPGGGVATSDQEIVDVTYDEDGDFFTELSVDFADGTNQTSTFRVSVFPPVITDFRASANAIRFGDQIQFTNLTQNAESQYENEDPELGDQILWEFPGGTPETSSEENPLVTYSVPGVYDVKLSVFRHAPTFGSIMTKTDFIQIVDVDVISPNEVKLVDVGERILLTYPTSLVDIDANQFTLLVDGAEATFSYSIAAGDPNAYELTLDTPIVEGQSITLNYAGGDFADTGELLGPIVDFTVENRVVNLFPKGDFEVDASTYDFANGFLGSNSAAISGDLVDGEGADGSKAMVFTVTDDTAVGAFRTVFGDAEKDNGSDRVNLITPVSSGKTYVVRAKVKYTGAKPQELGIKFITFPWNGQHQDSFLTLQDTNDWQDVEGEITITANINPEAYASPRIKVGGACEVILEDVRIYEK